MQEQLRKELEELLKVKWTVQDCAAIFQVTESEVETAVKDCHAELVECGFKDGLLPYRAFLVLGCVLPGKVARSVRDSIIIGEYNRPRQEREEWLVQSGIPMDTAKVLFPELFIEEKL
jgi:hypothetical protein